MKDATPEEKYRQAKSIVELLSGDVKLRSKRDLIEKFINENLPKIEDSDDIPDAFESFWSVERQEALEKLSQEENLDTDKLQKVIGDFMFTERKPLRDQVISLINQRPALRERGTIAERITSRIIGFVDTFISGIAG